MVGVLKGEPAPSLPQQVAAVRHGDKVSIRDNDMIRQLNAETCVELAHSVLMSTDVMASKRMVREKLHQSLGPELAFHTTSLSSHSQP